MEYSRDHRICSLRTGFRLVQVPLKTGFTVVHFVILHIYEYFASIIHLKPIS
jgi:hypothetical protein